MKIDYRKFGRKKLASIWLTNEEQQKETARVKALPKSFRRRATLLSYIALAEKTLRPIQKGC